MASVFRRPVTTPVFVHFEDGRMKCNRPHHTLYLDVTIERGVFRNGNMEILDLTVLQPVLNRYLITGKKKVRGNPLMSTMTSLHA